MGVGPAVALDSFWCSWQSIGKRIWGLNGKVGFAKVPRLCRQVGYCDWRVIDL